MKKAKLKIYNVEFDGVNPVGNCLVLAAYDQSQADFMAREALAEYYITKFKVKEIPLTEPQVIVYLSGDY